MAVKCGIVGLPNVGKSSLFNALTKMCIAAENYPFCTIEPNSGTVEVPDNRLDCLSEIAKPQRVLSAIATFVDIAGLVKGAASGEGLGNKFLANIRETDAIVHVVRCFEDDDIIHVNGKIDPLGDVATINYELMLADMETLNKSIEKEAKKLKANDPTSKLKVVLFERALAYLNADGLLKNMPMTEEELEMIKPLCLLTIKPVIFVANINYNRENPALESLKQYALKNNCQVLAMDVSLESEIANMSKEDKIAFLEEYGEQEAGLDRLIKASYKLLGLQTYFTVGEKEVRSWVIPVGAKAPQAAGVIHSDFEKGFIKAQVISYDNFVFYKSVEEAKKHGKLCFEGKEYIVQDGDVIEFFFH